MDVGELRGQVLDHHQSASPLAPRSPLKLQISGRHVNSNQNAFLISSYHAMDIQFIASLVHSFRL